MQCDVQPAVLVSNAAAVSGSVTTGGWSYYVMSASATSFTITAQETQGNGESFVFVFVL